MRQLLPPSSTPWFPEIEGSGAVDLEIEGLDALLRDTDRGLADRPWILTNMVSSLDGAATVDGVSGSIGGPADRVMFGAIRRLADTIVVGAGTARVERYRTPNDGTRLIIVSRSLNLPDDLPAIASGREGGARPVVIGPSTALSAQVERLSAGAEVILVDGDPTPSAVVTVAAELGAQIISCEGGPSLLAQFAAAELIDEWFVTIGSCVVAGSAPRIVSGHTEHHLDLRLVGLLEHDSTLFVHYLRDRGPADRGPADESLRP